MKKQHDKLMADIHRLLKTQNFNTKEDLEAFMKNMIGQKIPEFSDETLTDKEKAQDLVFEAYDLPLSKAKLNIEKALQLDPESIEAYEFLGSAEQSPQIASMFYEKGISIGEKLFGGKFLRENKGMFWGIHETRPFMRCLQHQSDCLYSMGKTKECISILEHMIQLNPNDNQGVRDQLLLYLIEENESEKFIKYSQQYKDDKMAFSLFNQALFEFKTNGICNKSNEKLKNAIKHNKFVVPKLLRNKASMDLPEHYGFGDENEAMYYVYFAYHIWHNTTGAINWLKN